VLCGPFVKRWLLIVGAIVTGAIAADGSAQSNEADAGDVQVEREFGVAPVWGVSAGQAQLISASIGIVVGMEPKAGSFRCGNAYWLDGVLLQVDAGLGGGKASVGLATSNPPYGMAIKASALRTWSRAWGATPDNTYVGLEAELVASVSLSLGYMRRVSGSGGPANLLTWGFGFGL